MFHKSFKKLYTYITGGIMPAVRHTGISIIRKYDSHDKPVIFYNTAWNGWTYYFPRKVESKYGIDHIGQARLDMTHQTFLSYVNKLNHRQ